MTGRYAALPATRDGQAGMSAVELVMMTAIMSVLMIMVTESMTTLSRVRYEQEIAKKVAVSADDRARRIEADLEYAKRIFCDAPEDIEYLDSMELGVSLSSESYHLPALTTNGYFAPDKGTPETGNILMMARRGPTVNVKYLGADHLLESMVFVVYAPIPDGDGIEFMRWTSDMMVNYWDVAEITDLVARQDILQQLAQNSVLYAWDPLAPRDSGFWDITVTGTLNPRPAYELITGREDAEYSRKLRIHQQQIAENGAEIKHTVPAFAKPNGSFPGGFEIKVDGTSSGKLLMLRLVIRSRDPRVQSISNEVRRLYPTSG